MNKAPVSAALFAVLAMSGCAGRADRPLEPRQPTRTSGQIAADALKPGFVGAVHIGAWSLVCRKAEEKQTSPSGAGEPVTSSVINKQGKSMLDIKINVPTRPCLVTAVLQRADRLERETAATFDLRGPYGVLFLIFRARKELFANVSPLQPRPPASSAGKSPAGEPRTTEPKPVTLRFGNESLEARRIGCGPFACIDAIKIRQEDEPALLAAKDIAVELPAFPGKPPVRVSLPLQGLAEAIGALRKVEK